MDAGGHGGSLHDHMGFVQTQGPRGQRVRAQRGMLHIRRWEHEDRGPKQARLHHLPLGLKWNSYLHCTVHDSIQARVFICENLGQRPVI